MEKNPQSEHIRYIDLLDELQDRQAFLRQITEAEAIPVIDDENEALDAALEKLDNTLGAGGEDEAAIFSGFAFKLDKDDEGDENVNVASQELLVDQALMFEGASYYEIDGETRILFTLRDKSVDPDIGYAAPFEVILRLEVMDATSRKYIITKCLMEHAIASKGQISDPDFLASDAENQSELLRSMAMSCYHELASVVDSEESAVECSTYYVHADAKDEKKFTVTTVDQESDNFEERTAVTGTIIGIIYLEVLQRELPFRRTADFIYGGVPCVTIRDDEAGTTTYIPLDKIEDIRHND